MKIKRIIVGQLEVNCYILWDEDSSEAIVIDPGDEFEMIKEIIETENLKPRLIVCTHAHYDHVCALRELKDEYGARLLMHENESDVYQYTKELCISWGYEPEDFPEPDVKAKDGDTVTSGSLTFNILHTPGHSPGSICLYGEGLVITGDTLFAGSAGRVDLSGGNIEALNASLKKLSKLPKNTVVLCGHGTETTIGKEIKYNPFMRMQ